jgi:hypothetical protein
MDPRLHLAMQISRAPVDSPELARRRETLREHDRAARARQAQRRRERVQQAVAFLTARRWRYDHQFGGSGRMTAAEASPRFRGE